MNHDRIAMAYATLRGAALELSAALEGTGGIRLQRQLEGLRVRVNGLYPPLEDLFIKERRKAGATLAEMAEANPYAGMELS